MLCYGLYGCQAIFIVKLAFGRQYRFRYMYTKTEQDDWTITILL